ncbi:YdeI/OmpD-associated family protein [Microbacterium sp. NIBRBAC000506063]|uniref:YdeI/OmpD-associated family protein n=1 Tax=Microbacterium sp. NIBRBAC000506063 TaxID=2734618 RepID=UPI001BB5C2EF|nr:YdeI/OmpD-associated family protein [Microbacterium sp. NIBRBAC000506063]QTV80915.1 YdeI/OmpD-associated family protein [Microbacterium sp. NIBRBAC000506063]
MAAWLAANHETARAVWLVIPRGSGYRERYEQAVRQALCFGWVDGQSRPHDGEGTLQRFSPRKPRSMWAGTNKARVAELEAAGLMTDAGRRVIENAKANGMWEVLDGPEAGVEPPELTAALDANPEARERWDAFPASARKFGLTAIALARRPETRAVRIARIVADAADGTRPG